MTVQTRERIYGSEPTEEEIRWARVHIMADKRKPLPEWWGKRR